VCQTPCILVVDSVRCPKRDRPLTPGWMRPWDSLGHRAPLPRRTRTVARALEPGFCKAGTAGIEGGETRWRQLTALSRQRCSPVSM
jgi:hypothetical protein